MMKYYMLHIEELNNPDNKETLIVNQYQLDDLKKSVKESEEKENKDKEYVSLNK